MHFAIRVRAEVAEGMAVAMIDEHVGYYGCPGGFAGRPAELVAGEPITYVGYPFGLFVRPDGTDVPNEPQPMVRLGYTDADNVEQWCTSAGNLTQIVWDDAGEEGTAVVRYWGRRHAQRWVPRDVIDGCLAILTYQTTEPEWPLWATRDHMQPATC